MASRSTANSGLRMDSVGLLKQRPDDPAVRESLVFSLRSDSNPGVRLKAEEALAPLVKEDVRVRNAMLEALLNDNNPGCVPEPCRPCPRCPTTPACARR